MVYLFNNHILDEYFDIFRGNIDDCFRIGFSFSNNSIKLYSNFYASDIIVASPLGLKLVTAGKESKKHEYDFLSSLEILLVDQMDIIIQQNWEHLNSLFEGFNLIPKETHNTDFSRVRMSFLDG